VWNCTDIVPGDVVEALADVELDFKRRTYADVAQAILAAMKAR